MTEKLERAAKNIEIDKKRARDNEWSSSLFGLFCSILIAVMVYVFYASELRSRLEDELFDLRTQIKPLHSESPRVAIVTINETDIVKIDGPLSKRPTVRTIENILEAIRLSDAEAIVLLLPRQDYDYDDDEMRPIIKWVRHHKMAYIGTYDYDSREPSELTLPAALVPIDERALGAGSLKRYRQGVVRKWPILSYTGVDLRRHVLFQTALDFADQDVITKLKEHSYNQIIQHKAYLNRRRNDNEQVPLPSIRLNYSLPHHFLSISASSLLEKTKDSRLTGRIVLLGYTAYRSRSISRRDGTHANTPWEGQLNPEIHSTPLVFIQGIALNNLIEGRWLQDAPIVVNIVQIMVMTTISFVIWMASPALAVVLFLTAFFGLIILHCVFFSYANLFVPLSDTLLFAFLATIVGAFLRARRESQKVASKKHRAHLQTELGKMQGHFLNRFSVEIDEINDRIIQRLSNSADRFVDESTVDRSFRKALGSSYELKEYLAGIKQVAALSETDQYHVTKHTVILKPLIQTIIRKFETVLEEKDLTIVIDISDSAGTFSDELILEPILFNLISNAIKYSYSGNSVTISAHKISRHRRRISVCDNGPGIAEEFKIKIFEKFYRIKNDDVYKIKGNGLGLYLCQFFAMKLETQIELESHTDKGSRFWLDVEST